MAQQTWGAGDYRPELLELAAGYAEESVIVTTAKLDLPGPQILYVNSAFTRMTGYAQHELLGKTPRILQGPRTDRSVLRRLREDLQAGRNFIGRTFNYRRDGRELELEWIISHIRDEAGQTTHYIAVQRDVTGRDFAQAELQRRDAELERASAELVKKTYELHRAQRQLIHQQRLAALGNMAAGVVHDINNALTPMGHMIELLEHASHLDEQTRSGLRSLESGVEHLRQLVQNLHTFYYDVSDVQDEDVDLQSVLGDIREVTQAKWKTEAQAAGATIQFDVSLPAAPPVKGNPVELRQVIVNLVFNAVEAMRSGGQLEVRLFAEGRWVVVEVEDTGTGLSDEALSHCFEPYYTTRSHGTGLGLSVCHGIISRHGGRISAHRSDSGGALFRVLIPAIPLAMLHSAPLQVLYIDADQASRTHLAERLREQGHLVTPAASADEGLESFYGAGFDCVIVNLDSSAGAVNAAAAMKQGKPEVPVVVLTKERRHEILRSFAPGRGPDAVMERPATKSDLERLIQAAATHDSEV